jgi:hypothetical protein
VKCRHRRCSNGELEHLAPTYGGGRHHTYSEAISGKPYRTRAKRSLIGAVHAPSSESWVSLSQNVRKDLYSWTRRGGSAG